MEVTAYGFESFRLQGKSLDILINPIDSAKTGYKAPVVTPDVVLISSEKDYTDQSRAKGEGKVFDRPGEYEIKGSVIHGYKVSDGVTSYLINMDDLRIVYLGEVKGSLSDEVLEELSDADLLFVPVGDHDVLSGKQASEVVSQISPRIVVPTHYKTAALKLSGYQTAETFLHEGGIKCLPETKLKVNRKDLPEELEVVLLEP